MGYKDIFRSFLNGIKRITGLGSKELQPRDILDELIAELERKRKLGIEENAFVPNVYAVYLSSMDFDDNSPLLSGIKEQLKNKLMERVEKKDYRLLASSITIEIGIDQSLQGNEIIVESSFQKDEIRRTPLADETVTTTSFASNRADDVEKTNRIDIPHAPRNNSMTRIIEERNTTFIDNTQIQLEVIDGENRGEIIPLKVGEYIVGRGREATILLRDQEETISRLHFKIVVKEGSAIIRDLNSLNTTKLNSVVVEEAELKIGDMITAGKIVLGVV